jgi:hypothetical protein
MDNCGQEEKTEGDYHHRSNRLHPFFSVPPLPGEEAKAMAASQGRSEIQRNQIKIKAMAAIIQQGLGPRIKAMAAIIQEGSGPRGKAMAASTPAWRDPIGKRYVQLFSQQFQTQTSQEQQANAKYRPWWPILGTQKDREEKVLERRPMEAKQACVPLAARWRQMDREVLEKRPMGAKQA